MTEIQKTIMGKVEKFIHLANTTQDDRVYNDAMFEIGDVVRQSYRNVPYPAKRKQYTALIWDIIKDKLE